MGKKKDGIQGYLMKVINGMSLGLFSSLIIGLIIKQTGSIFNIPFLMNFGDIAQRMMGPAIGVAVAHSVGASNLALFASAVTGAIGAGSITYNGALVGVNIGEPVGAFVAALVGAEVSKLISGKTKLDIILVPSITIISGGLAGNYIGPYISAFMNQIGSFINTATHMNPIPMGIIVSVVMGMLLTFPVSSAAVAISLNLSGFAAGAATVGCCANMVGFAVASYRENGFSGLISQGIGTSMLQMPNIIANPLIWIPAIVASAILGPISTYVLKMTSNSIGAGMGTSGLVGQFAMIETMGSSPDVLMLISLMHFILPAVISLTVSEWMRRKGWIKAGDMKL